jgi:hypothetical protein
LQGQSANRGIESPDATNAMLDSENLQLLDEADDDLEPSVPTKDGLPIIDWHSGPTLMDAWLSQSAIPMDSGIVQEINDEQLQDKEALEQERQDIEVLRKVYLSAEPEAPDIGRLENKIYDGLDEIAKPFLRKILDKFPLIQPFLARRLAESSLARDVRLRKSRDDQGLRRLLLRDIQRRKRKEIKKEKYKQYTNRPQRETHESYAIRLRNASSGG